MNDDDCGLFSPKADNKLTCQSNVGNSDATFKEPRRVKPSYLYPNGSDPAKDQQKVYNFRMPNKPKFVVGTHKETTSNGLFGAKQRTSVSTGVGIGPITTYTEPKISTPRMPNFTSRTTKTQKRILSPSDENCRNSAKIAEMDNEDTSFNEELQLN
ncbi:unnamed protein product [Brachionus calyciflorus]|uniref:Uncharacterized protein n=1 Tax=Brachionus calyciflorus TaxID=104777 RepID=A0A814D300_9BILA|nr:unnamed protein product [Brachionus calyciflorus]